MIPCEKCKNSIDCGDEYQHNSTVICEDCYIDILLPPVRKMYYESSSANFMIRLKDSHIACPQQFH